MLIRGTDTYRTLRLAVAAILALALLLVLVRSAAF